MNAKDVYESVCMICSQGKQDGGAGTAFFISHNNKIYICTNAHVLCGHKYIRTQLTLFFHVKNNKTGGLNLVKTKSYINQEWIIKSDNYDLAIYPVDKYITDVINKGYEFDHYVITTNDIANEYSQYEYIENVIIAGYPSQLMDSKTHRPLMSSGITSTPIFLPFENKDEFLINVTSYHGNSGSPVFVKKQNEYKLIGIAKGAVQGNTIQHNINISNNYHITKADMVSELTYTICIKSIILLSLK